MKNYLLIIFCILLTACTSSHSDNQSPKEIVVNSPEMIEYSGNNFNISYPSTWHLEMEEMNNPQNPTLITASIKIRDRQFINFQIMNLIDTAELDTAVNNFITKQNLKTVSNLKKVSFSNGTFLNSRIKLDANTFCESFFLKENDNLFWFTFFGLPLDLTTHGDEINSIVKSFITDKSSQTLSTNN